MYPVTPGFLTQLRSGAREWQCKIEVYVEDDFVATITDIVDGSVTVEQGSDCRRKFSATLGNSAPTWEVTPTYPDENEYGPTSGDYGDGQFSDQPFSEISGLFIPRLTELRVYEALKVSGSWEWVPLGVFRLVEFTASRAVGDRSFSITAEDVSLVYRGAGFEIPYQVNAGTYRASAIADLIDYAWPGTTIDDSGITGDSTLPDLVFFDGTAWEEAQRLADEGGWELYADVDGTFILRDVPDWTGTAVEDLTADSNDLKLNVSRSVSEANVYSGVRIQGTHADAAEDAYAVAWDENPDSPTYYLGQFGMKLLTESVDTISTAAQAAQAADARLRQVAGWDEAVEVSLAKHPALDAGDVVTMSEGSVGMVNPATYIIDQISYPLGMAPMTVRARRRFTL